MSDYNQFVMAVNKIFEITAKLKAGWKDQDNINIADSIEESKTAVVDASKQFNTQNTQPQQSQQPITQALEEDPIEDEIGVLDE